MTDTAHRVAASRHIRKHLDASHREWLARREQNDGRRLALLKLALSATELHAKAMAKDMLPRDGEERSKPLLVALTALETIIRNEGASQ
jgi:hypothetical protein